MTGLCDQQFLLETHGWDKRSGAPAKVVGAGGNRGCALHHWREMDKTDKGKEKEGGGEEERGGGEGRKREEQRGGEGREGRKK